MYFTFSKTKLSQRREEVFHYKTGKSSTYPAKGLASTFPFAPSNNYTKAGTQALPTDFISLHILALNLVVSKLGNELTMFSRAMRDRKRSWGKLGKEHVLLH